MPSAALAETDTVYPDHWLGSYGRSGVAKIDVHWSRYSAAFDFSSVEVWDTRHDGYCVIPMVSIDRRFQGNSGWMYLNGATERSPILGNTDAYGLTCGNGRHFNDPAGDTIYGSRTPFRELTGVRGAWFTLCIAHGSVDSMNYPKADIVTCGPTRYAANNGS
jgi:hypothetical protein